MCKKTFYSFVSHTISWICVKPMAFNILFGLKCPIWSPFLIFIIHPRLCVSIYVFSVWTLLPYCCLDFGLFQKPKKLLDRTMVSTSTTPPPPYPHAPPKKKHPTAHQLTLWLRDHFIHDSPGWIDSRGKCGVFLSWCGWRYCFPLASSRLSQARLRREWAICKEKCAFCRRRPFWSLKSVF